MEAAQDLGANTTKTLVRVLIPMSVPGISTGITMVFVPAVSTFVISRMLGGGSNLLIGDLIEMQFLGNSYNLNVGSAMSLVLMIIVLLLSLIHIYLSKSYGSRPAVQDLSFTVPDGQIYGLLGPNGAGKSTIMNILTGYLAPTEGEVKVAGFRLPEQAQQAKACLGYLPEQPPLYPEMTVQEYLDFVAELKGVKHAQRKQQVLAAARRTGLEEVLPRVIRSLSKGYRQRVGIAQALLRCV